MSEAYEQLKAHYEKIYRAEEGALVLRFENRTVIERTGALSKVDEIAWKEAAVHTLRGDPRIEDWLQEAEKTKDSLSKWDQENLRYMHEEYILNVSIPEDLIEKTSHAIHTARRERNTAIDKNDATHMTPYVEKVVQYKNEIGGIKASVLNTTPEGAAIHQYMPYTTEEDLDQFSKDMEPLFGLIEKVKDKQQKEPAPLPLDVTISKNQQQEFLYFLWECFDMKRDQIQIEEVMRGNFSVATSDKSRIGVRLCEDDILRTISGGLHEMGHALYHAQRPKDFTHQPVGRANGFALNESQAFLLQMNFARSHAFCDFLSDQFQDRFHLTGPEFSGENLYRLMTRIQPDNKIRIQADELTLPAHITVREDVEPTFFSGQNLDDIPQHFNDRMTARLGVTPENAAEGIYQDPHFTLGHRRYFTAYKKGMTYSAQFNHTFREQTPDFDDNVRRGDFSQLKDWLRDNIHQKGRLMKPEELVEHVTGEKPTVRYWFEDKYKRYLGTSATPAATPSTMPGQKFRA